VKEIAPGLIHELNQRCPGTIEVGDHVVKVNGEEGRAFKLIREFAVSLDGPKSLHLTVLRPVEFDVAIDVSAAGRELGMEIMDVGFVRQVAKGGMVESHNIAQEAKGLPCLREGDRVMEVSGRAPATEDGAAGNVLPYLRLAMCGGASPLQLRVRRGDYMPKIQDVRRVSVVSTMVPMGAGAAAGNPAPADAREKPRFAAAVAAALTPSSALPRSAGSALRYLLSRRPGKADRSALGRPGGLPGWSRVDSKQSKVCDEQLTTSPLTASTAPTRQPSSCASLSDASDAEAFPAVIPSLTLPGIVQRQASSGRTDR